MNASPTLLGAAVLSALSTVADAQQSAPAMTSAEREIGKRVLCQFRSAEPARLGYVNQFHAFATGPTYHIDLAIRDDHVDYRSQLVSLGYTLRQDKPKADINALKQ